jgi:topoisomerase IV subunit B
MQTLSADPLIPLFEGEGYAENNDSFAEGEGASWAVAFTEDGQPVRESYVNLIPTSAGGTHDSGLRDGLFNAVKSFIELHSLLPKGVKLLPEDVFARASYVLSAKVLDPQFQGQIKERLNSRDAVRLVSSFVRPALELWLNQHVEYGKKLAELAIKAAQTRQRAGQKVEKRKGSGVAVLPGKLTDCESRDLTHNELFLVEGDSAGGSAKMGRDKESQAILPLRGKVLNTWEVERDRLFANTEVHDISVAIGVDPHGPSDAPDLSGLRYGKVCILSRCRCGRFAHPGAAAHALLPPLSQAHRNRPRLRGAPAAVPCGCSRTRQESGQQGLCPGRGRADRHPGQMRQGRRGPGALPDQPLQGPGRDERRAAMGDHAQPRHAPPAAGAPGHV